LVLGLTDDGRRDLSEMRLTEMENEVYGLLDIEGDQMLQALLERQAGQIDDAEACPTCGGPLRPKPPQTERASVTS
jgi:hypothetical protein